MKSDDAEKAFMSGFNCAQSVFVPFAAQTALGAKSAARVASPFGGGMGKSQQTCGAVTGGLMALGLEHGFDDASDKEGKDSVLAKTKEFMAGFKERFGTLQCRELLGCDLNTDEGQKVYKDSNKRETTCLDCVRHAAAAVEAMAGKK